MIEQQRAFEESVLNGGGDEDWKAGKVTPESVVDKGDVTVLFDSLVEEVSPRPGVSFEESVKVTLAAFEPSSWQSDKSWDRIPKSDSFASIDELSIDADSLFIDGGEVGVLDGVPEGRRVLHEEKLVDGGKMWIPETQDDPARFMTTDMLEEQERVFERMGTSSGAAKKRAKMQSVMLKSDMEAFKAANCGCVMEDFVNWHSPRDVVDGVLSERMAVPGNLWGELWRRTRGVPASRQKALFDCEVEAEKTLGFLQGASPGFIVAQLLPTMFLAAYHTLVSNGIVGSLPSIRLGLDELSKKIVDVKWDALILNFDGEYIGAVEHVIRAIRDVEEKIGVATSLIRQFPSMDYRLIDSILVEGRVLLTSAGDRGIVKGLAEKAKAVRMEVVFEDLLFEDGYGGNRLCADVDMRAGKVIVAERTVQL
jgi:hypothetical protein